MKLEPNNLINYPYYSIAWLALGGKRPFKTLTRALIVSGVLFGVEIATAQIGTAVRELPYDFHPGDLISVRIQVTPPPGTTNWLVSESYPVRWDFISVSSTNASNTNEFSSVLTFGPFSNAVPQTLSYEISSVPGLTNSESFTGRVVFNGTTNTTVGTTNLPARNEWLFAGPQSLQQGTVDGIAYGAGRWVASYRGWITTLETGGRLTYPRAPHYIPLASLAYLGGLFLLYGSGADEAGAAQMWISDDGLTWKQSQPESSDTNANPFAFQGEVRSVAYGNGVYVGVGQHRYLSETLAGQSPHGAIWRSTNGYNWRRIFVLPINTTNTTTIISLTFTWGGKPSSQLILSAIAWGSKSFPK